MAKNKITLLNRSENTRRKFEVGESWLQIRYEQVPAIHTLKILDYISILNYIFIKHQTSFLLLVVPPPNKELMNNKLIFLKLVSYIHKFFQQYKFANQFFWV